LQDDTFKICMEREREGAREREKVEAMDQTLQCIAISTPAIRIRAAYLEEMMSFPGSRSRWRSEDEFHIRSQEHESACLQWIIFLWH
jgi:hypothetical protein